MKSLVGIVFLALSACVAESPSDTKRVAGIAYDVSGVGDITLIFVHGWSCDRTYWREQISPFSQDYRVVTIDLAGHGESERSGGDYSMLRFATDIKSVADDINAQKLVLIGHSMGGPVVLETASLMPDRTIGVIGVDTLKRTGFPPMSQATAKQAWSSFEADFSTRTRSMVRGSMFTKGSQQELKQEISVDMAAMDSEVALKAGVQMMMYDTSDALANVSTIPVTLINASYTPTDIGSLESVHSNIRVIEIDESGHFIMLEKPAEFNSTLKAELIRITN